MIPDETIEQVRESADLVGIIGESVELKRTGADYRGPCPFHGGTHREAGDGLFPPWQTA